MIKSLRIDYSKRTYGLDIYRALAIIFVVHGHGAYMLNDTFLEGIPWIKLVSGVELFFVLSGFLIGTILFKMIENSDNSLSLNDIGYFWKRRWFRTLPNYYLILVINILLVKYSIISGDINQFNYKFFFFLQNFSSSFQGFFWESWSLTIEEWFYIILPLFIFFFLKFTTPKKAYLIVITLLIMMPLLYRLYLSPTDLTSLQWDLNLRKIVITRLDAIIYGVLAAYIKFYYEDFWVKHANLAFIIGIIFTLIILYMPKDANDFFSKTFYFNCISIGAMLMLPFADSIKKFKSTFGKIITHISILSYAMYLINSALVKQVMKKNIPISNPSEGLIHYFFYWVIVLLLSYLLYKFYEKPMTDLRDK